MKSLPLPAVVAALAALVTLPFHAAATLFLTAGLGAIIHADYVLRCRSRRWSRLTARLVAANRAPLPRETNRLAA